MLILAIALFTIAAALGFYLISFLLQDKEMPKGIALVHGPVAAIGLILLIVYAFTQDPAPIVSLVLFILAAMGGTMLIYRDMTGQNVPKWMAIGHGFTALAGYVFLVVFTFL